MIFIVTFIAIRESSVHEIHKRKSNRDHRYSMYIWWYEIDIVFEIYDIDMYHQGPFLLTWIDFNPNMDK